MSITEEKLYESFGIENPNAAGAKDQDPAEPEKNQEPAAGAKDQDPAEPDEAAEEAQELEDQEQEPAQDPESGDQGKKPQTPEQRRENAAKRRREEQQAAIDQAVQEAVRKNDEKHQADLAALLKQAGLKNTVTGEAITDLDGLRKWHSDFSDAQLQEDLKAGRLTEESLQALIEKNPVVRKAQELIDSQANSAQKAQEAEAAQKIQKDLETIRARGDTQVMTAADLMKLPEGEAIREMVFRGYSFADAHKLATEQRLNADLANRAAAAAAANARGKGHLQAASAGRGTGMDTVPPEMMRLFRAMPTGMTDEQITSWYNKHKK